MFFITRVFCFLPKYCFPIHQANLDDTRFCYDALSNAVQCRIDAISARFSSNTQVFRPLLLEPIFLLTQAAPFYLPMPVKQGYGLAALNHDGHPAWRRVRHVGPWCGVLAPRRWGRRQLPRHYFFNSLRFCKIRFSISKMRQRNPSGSSSLLHAKLSASRRNGKGFPATVS